MTTTPKHKKTRSHLPSLSQLKRDMLRLQLEANPAISRPVSEAIMASFNAAANPGAESPEVVIKTLEPDEQMRIMQASMGYRQILGVMGERGKMALLQMSEAEWNDLIDDKP